MNRLHKDLVMAQFGLPSVPLSGDKFLSFLLSQIVGTDAPSEGSSTPAENSEASGEG